VLGTQEIDAADVLEVTDLANAIARAEEVIRARSSRVLTSGPESAAGQDGPGEDIFDKLVASSPNAEKTTEDPLSATDDAVGPAVHAPYRPTPLPPRTTNIPLPPGIQRPATLLRAPEDVLATPIPTAPVTPRRATLATLLPPTPVPPAASVHATQPLAAMRSSHSEANSTIPPAARTAPILILDEDAFYHPAGRIRTLADVTIDGYRPEPTLMLRLRERRQSLTWVVGAILAALALLAIFAVAVGFGRATADASRADTSKAPTTTIAAPTTPKHESVPAANTTPKAEVMPAGPATTATTATPATPTTPAAAAMPVTAMPDVPVFDVNSLKNAPPARR